MDSALNSTDNFILIDFYTNLFYAEQQNVWGATKCVN